MFNAQDFTMNLNDLSAIYGGGGLNETQKDDNECSISILRALEVPKVSKRRKREESFKSRRNKDFKYMKRFEPKKPLSYGLKEGIQNIKSRYERTLSKKRYDSKETVKPKKKSLKLRIGAYDRNLNQKSISSKPNSKLQEGKMSLNGLTKIQKFRSNSKKASCLQNLISDINREKEKKSMRMIEIEKKKNLITDKSFKNKRGNYNKLSLNSMKAPAFDFVTPKMRRDMQMEVHSGRDSSTGAKRGAFFQSVQSELMKSSSKKVDDEAQSSSKILSSSNCKVSQFDIDEPKNYRECRKPKKDGLFFFPLKKKLGSPRSSRFDKSRKRREDLQDELAREKVKKLESTNSLKKLIIGIKSTRNSRPGELMNRQEEEGKRKRPVVSKRRNGAYFANRKKKKSVGRKRTNTSNSRRNMVSLKKKISENMSIYQIKTLSQFLTTNNFANLKKSECYGSEASDLHSRDLG